MAIDNLGWLAHVLRAEGLTVTEIDGWRQRGHGYIDDAWGVVCHHTGSDTVAAEVVADGTADLPGPLSHILVGRDGSATVVAAGIAHHAGHGSYPDLPANKANAHTIGIHAVSDGRKPYPLEQYQAFVQCCAAIVAKIGQPASHVIGHKEWDLTKHDPSLSMDQLRADIADRIPGRNRYSLRHGCR
ncbi:peptidoglycan recognition protein family protein [Mycobacterium aquaticum]|uniref:peptidoglycan recognition protein family protein n=1 Tax=Mycobacterium aquaticum TaxID=1927124 RepID=UPI001FEAE16F|nr:peptidoglycan recognition family protein [Mycobacterium aquaticum]